jgi:beta-galactosidase
MQSIRNLILAAVVLGASIPGFLHAEPAHLPNGTGSPDSVVMDDSWRLWLDQTAPWKEDRLYLPEEVDLTKIPVNPPTGGWDVLSDQAGIPVTLPDTVEAHYWGKSPLRTADSNKPTDIVNLNSPYDGVSWWYRNFTPPNLKSGEHLVFSFPGARLRAEVYVNGQLVGYNIVSEIPFTADATNALKPGEPNQMAIRITNIGGVFSWGDFYFQEWGRYQLPITHGFGGISGGVTMAVHGPVVVDDLYVANNPDSHEVTLNATVDSTGPAYKGPLALSISRDGRTVWNGSVDVDLPAGGSATASQQVTVPDAELWDIGHPVIYQAAARIASVLHSDRTTDFGFRWFNAEGIGTDPKLVLNGKRIFIKSAISWGFWAPNGLFPDKEAVQREIKAVQELGLNCVQTHRHFPKAEVLDGFDHAGLLRYCEPGGGSSVWDESNGVNPTLYSGPIDTSGTGGEPTSFFNHWEMDKITAMIKAYRSHPSLIMWSLKNESAADLHNRKLFYLMNQVHQLDPSRIVILKSGYGPGGEVMGRPYDTQMYYGDGGNDSGWHDNHNEDDTGVYQDSLYKSPTDFKCYTTDSTGIAMWGELGTADSPDDFTATVKWYQEHNIPGYNRTAAEVRLAAYDAFLDKYNFRSAFPTASSLFQAVGARHYFDAAHITENARIADANDYIALTGWESTTVDNNSGLVDALRNLKGDPALMKQATAPTVLVIRARHYVIAKGDAAVVDAFSVNEVNLHGDFTLHFTAAMNSDPNKPFFDVSFPVTLKGGDIFGQLLKDGISFTPPDAGPVTMSGSLTPANGLDPVMQRTEPLLVVDPNPAPITGAVACADYDGKLIPALQSKFGITAAPVGSPSDRANIIILSSSGSPQSTLNVNQVQRTDNAKGTDDPGLYSEEALAKEGDLVWYKGLAPGDATVELFFAETFFNDPGNRVFDIAANGKTVLRHFDICGAAGGKNTAVVKKFSVPCPDGKLIISIPRVQSDQPEIAAIRITDANGQVIREVFRRESYQSPTGETWNAANPVGFDWPKAISGVLDRVRRGARLIVLGGDAREAGQAAQVLADQGILTYSGLAGDDDTPWIGHWYFSRKHWLLNGLPSGCVLDWQYQEAAPGNGLVLDAPGLDAVIGYGKNPGPNLGFGAVVVPLGQGQIVLLAMGGLTDAFVNDDAKGFVPVVAQRIVYNALQAR